jgi:hypothetical protein
LIAILTVALAGLAALAAVIATSLRSAEPPPATGAAALVPGDALAYVHLSTDATRPAVRQAIALAARFPDVPLARAALSARLGAILTRPGAPAGTFDFSDVRPWLGSEAAFALLNTASTTAGSLILLDVRSRPRAQAFLAGGGATPVGSHRGVTELGYRPGTVIAFVRHYLAIGQRASVDSAIDVADGSAPSLAANPAYARAASPEPTDRVLDAYVSDSGVRRVLLPRGGLLGALGRLLLAPALSGTTISLSAAPGGARVTVHSALDPSLARISGPPAPRFTPTLASVLPAGSSLLLDVHGLARAAPGVLAASATAGIAPQLGPLFHRFGVALSSEGVNVANVLSLFSGETAVAISPGAGKNGGPAPVIETRAQRPDQARALLGNLEGPLAQLFPPPSDGPGQAPVWNDVATNGITVRQLSISPGLQLDYAVFRGLVVVSTSVRAIGAVARHSSTLAGAERYGAVLPGGSSRVTSLLFLDFSQLLSLGEQIGLTASARLPTVRPDLERIRAVGLTSSRGEAETTAELFLQIP